MPTLRSSFVAATVCLSVVACSEPSADLELDLSTDGKFDRLDGKRISLRGDAAFDYFAEDPLSDYFDAWVLLETDEKIVVRGTSWHFAARGPLEEACTDDFECDDGKMCSVSFGSCQKVNFTPEDILRVELHEDDRSQSAFVLFAYYFEDMVEHLMPVTCPTGNLLTAVDLDLFDHEVIIDGVGYSFSDCGISLPANVDNYDSLFFSARLVPTIGEGKFVSSGFFGQVL